MYQSKRLLTFALLAMAVVITQFLAEAQAEPVQFDWNRVLSDPADTVSQFPRERERLESRINQADTPTRKSKAQLALANWWLSTRTARPATRLLIGAETATDRKAIAEAASKATFLIASARALLDTDPPTTQEVELRQQRRRLQQSADTLAAFADVFKLMERGADDESSRDAWRKAGRGLAVARESEEADWAAAARLWQAFAMDMAGRTERALDILPISLLKPEHLPYDLMCQVLRCRLLARSGQQAAATALLSRMETILKTWVPSQERNRARRLIAFVQYHVVGDWIKHLRSSSRPASANPLEAVLDAINTDFADLKSPNIYYMETAIPMKVSLPTDDRQEVAPLKNGNE